MEVNSNARYFFPSNINRLKSTVWSPLVSMHRREMSQRLAISRMDTPKRYDSRVSGRISKTVQSQRLRTYSRNIGERICKTIESEQLKSVSNQPKDKIYGNKLTKNRGATQSIGLKNLLQKAIRLQLQDVKLSCNPFFKIQKKRNSRKWKIHGLGFNHKQHNQEQIQTQQHKEQLFHNSSLVSVNDEYSPKLRAKSETVTYYEIKDYYESKYGREATQPF